ncbi:unnamed protein product [Somion occarium]|uniref:Uncharacterized protein n=1 Tax=Somion occarium TaxID=3059160 RepID=A0ABP1E653_9APHY
MCEVPSIECSPSADIYSLPPPPSPPFFDPTCSRFKPSIRDFARALSRPGLLRVPLVDYSSPFPRCLYMSSDLYIDLTRLRFGCRWRMAWTSGLRFSEPHEGTREVRSRYQNTGYRTASSTLVSSGTCKTWKYVYEAVRPLCRGCIRYYLNLTTVQKIWCTYIGKLAFYAGTVRFAEKAVL